MRVRRVEQHGGRDAGCYPDEADLGQRMRVREDRTSQAAGKLLVVDDSATIRKVIQQHLEGAGYRVEIAESGEQAFERCLRERFDLVVSDVTMGALSGMQLCRLLRADPVTSRMPVVLLTARTDPRSRFWGRHAGADAYLTKDRVHQDLVALVGRIFARLPDDKRASLLPPRRAADPLERLSKLLDDLLFKAVMASDVRRLASEAKDRKAFSRAVLSLAAEVADYAYLVFQLHAPPGSTYALHARDPWPEPASKQALAALDLPDDGELDVVVEEAGTGEQLASSGAALHAGKARRFNVSSGGETLGVLIAYSGRRRRTPADAETLQVLADEIGLAAKNVFLMEATSRLAFTDPLTGLNNRHHTAQFLDQEVERARRYRNALSIILCDVDHFKSVNDTYGHNVGDDVLRSVSHALAKTMRKVDVVGRWGGEEFLLVLPNTGESGARIVAERLRRHIEAAPAHDPGPRSVTISLGVASYRGGSSAEAFVERADRALYEAKRRGRNRVELAT
ncbi:MAG: diguanylate cyclase [Proteobacteria bacterium]|nr:diguanylate cyclase [Pseudomonadota bacterium]